MSTETLNCTQTPTRGKRIAVAAAALTVLDAAAYGPSIGEAKERTTGGRRLTGSTVGDHIAIRISPPFYNWHAADLACQSVARLLAVSAQHAPGRNGSTTGRRRLGCSKSPISSQPLGISGPSRAGASPPTCLARRAALLAQRGFVIAGNLLDLALLHGPKCDDGHFGARCQCKP